MCFNNNNFTSGVTVQTSKFSMKSKSVPDLNVAAIAVKAPLLYSRALPPAPLLHVHYSPKVPFWLLGFLQRSNISFCVKLTEPSNCCSGLRVRRKRFTLEARPAPCFFGSFWNNHTVVQCEFFPKGQTANSFLDFLGEVFAKATQSSPPAVLARLFHSPCFDTPQEIQRER